MYLTVQRLSLPNSCREMTKAGKTGAQVRGLASLFYRRFTQYLCAGYVLRTENG
jgi:hypothetical protein